MISSLNDSHNTCSLLYGLTNSLTINYLATLNASSVDFSNNQSTRLQSKIYDLQRHHARDSLVDFINDLNKIACYRSNIADDARHAAYLSV